ncbi:MAG: TRAM domain-containing protein, partial [Rothia dentocariosa]|nr:TRAM domain-containing protein [Rothia dentocariosa]
MRQLDSTSTRVPTNTAPSRGTEPVSGYAIGDLVRLTCESPAHGGAFVARSEKGVVFVRHALTGETVQARITDIGPKNRYYFADAVAIDTPSPARREHPWVQGNSLLTDEERAAATGVKELLGGMEYGHIDPATQRAYKTDTLRTQLIRLGGISPDSPLITSLTVEPMPTKDLTEGDLSWRSRVRYTVVKTPSGWRIGMYPHQSSRAVPVIDFPLAARELRQLNLHELD